MTSALEIKPTAKKNNRVIRQPVLDETVKSQINEILSGNAPVEIEIGCGKGKFLVARAASYPDTRFIGLDRVKKWMKRAIRKIENRKSENIFFFKADGVEVLKQCVPFERVEVFHVYFPDPWPKRRHHKRRLLAAPFFKLLFDRLKPGGRAMIATDHKEYYDFIAEEINKSGLNWTIRAQINRPFWEESAYKTNYELKFEAAGRNLHYLELTKR